MINSGRHPSIADSIRIVSTMARFSATIYKIDINPVVDPPEMVLAEIFQKADKSKGPIPVRGKLNGVEFSQTLVKFRGAWRLYINAPMLKDSGLKVGDIANIDLEYDPRQRDVAMPNALVNAFGRDRSAREAFDRLTPSRQKEILRYVGSLKTREAVVRNVERVIRQLREKS